MQEATVEYYVNSTTNIYPSTSGLHILTPDNQGLDTARIPNSSDTLHFCILDCTDIDNIDYRFPPIVFIEIFPKAAFELKINNYLIQVPLDWSILLGDPENNELEVVPLKDFRGRDYSAFIFNPCTGYLPTFRKIEISNIYHEVNWSIPTMKSGYMLTVPLCGGDNPPCAFFVDMKNKIPEVIDIHKLF